MPLKPKQNSLFLGDVGKVDFEDQVYQRRLFQQSVTLTAAMWNENESERNLENWKFGNWSVPGKYSPLFMGLVCGFLIVLIVTTAVVLWKYCLLSARKKVCCRGTYSVMTRQEGPNSWPGRKEKKESLSGFERFNRIGIDSVKKPLALRRSIKMGSITLNPGQIPVVDLEIGASKHPEENFSKMPSSNSNLESSQVELLVSRDIYTTHLHFQKLYLNSDLPKNVSKSAFTLEDASAMVNFSKKRKNRMRKDDAVIIAMSKSHSGNNRNSLEQTCSAIIVYNERTAL